MAIRKALRQEPYESDAIDADNDGIVQEGTAWERPAGTRLLDEFGREVVRGSTSGSRSPTLRVARPDGSTVAYRPSYSQGLERAKPGGQTPLGSAGYRSIAESNISNLGQISGQETLGQSLGDSFRSLRDIVAPDNTKN